MAFVERRTIAELGARYSLEPSLRDIFVEGRRDRALLSWFLQVCGVRNAEIFEIDSVEMPSDIIAMHGLRPGRRGAVVALALELCRCVGVNLPQVTCIADRDGEDVARYSECSIIRFTDFASLEMYFFDRRILAKLLTVAAARGDIEADELLQNLQPTLRKLFAIREANLALNLGLDWLSFERCCQLTNGGILFDADDFIRRYLNKSAKLSALSRFLAEVEYQESREPEDIRMFMNGHDFIDLLSWYLRTAGIRRTARPEEVADFLFLSAEVRWLFDYPLFRDLLDRVSDS